MELPAKTRGEAGAAGADGAARRPYLGQRPLVLLGVLLLLVGFVLPARGQTPPVPPAGGGFNMDDYEIDTDQLNQVIQTTREWATNNLDEDLVRALSQVDQQAVRDFLKQFQTWLQGDSVFDAGQLRDVGTTVLPLLEAHPETQPYAAWLRQRLDYLAVAQQLQAAAPPPAPPAAGQPVPRRPNPTYQMQKRVWMLEVAQRPAPREANPLVPKLKPIFSAAGVPPQLVWLAEVESGFNPRAESPAGAVGLFQLMPATARQYGLRVWPFDQRREPETEARAAARYLADLHRQFGDWRLVLAAYNSGSGNVRRLLKRYHTQNFDVIAPHLPAETQLYVPKIAALILRREGVELADLH